MLLEAEITVNVTQTMPTVATEVNKELVIPLRFFKKHPNNLLQEDYIDMGLISNIEVAHRYNLNVENRYGKHIVITKVAVEKKAIGMNFKIATTFGYKIAIAPNTQPFTILALFATPLENRQKGFVSGTIHIYVDVAGIPEKVSVPFFCGVYLGMLGSDQDLSFEVPKTMSSGQVVHKTRKSLQNKFTSDLVIRDVYFNDIDNNQPTAIFTSTTTNRRVSFAETFDCYIAQFMMPVTYYDTILSKGIELATVDLFNSFTTVLIKYFTMSLMCGFNGENAQFEKCGKIEKLDFEYIALGHRKVRTIDLYNPTTTSFIIKRVEFAIGNGNVEVSFENHFKDSMKSYYKKASSSINTFVLIPQNQIVSVRIKVKPREYGNFRETVTLFTNMGEYVFAITYKGVQGEILFTPSTLRFDLFYPIESDEKSVIANNKYNIPVEILGTWSQQPFIFTDLKSSQLMPNTKESFMNVLLDLKHIDQIEDSRNLYMKAEHDHYVALSDLVAYEDQAVGWENILREAKTEITGEVVVQTDILNDLKINVKGHLRKALFVPEDKLVFGPLEENRTHLVNITITNPTEKHISMRFYLADNRMIDSKSINKKIVRRLSRKYARYKEEHVCMSHNSLSEDSIRYYASVMFDKVSFKNFSLKKNPKNRVCFVINHPRPSHNRFFNNKGNQLFNITRHSKKQLIRDTKTAFILKDVLKLSRRSAPPNAQSLYGISLLNKLKLMMNRGFSILHRKLHKNALYSNSDNASFVSGLMPSVMKTIFQKQEFFISRKFRNKKLVVPPGKTLTLPILQCYPREIGEGQMNLLIKNNYSRLIILPISAQLGKARLIVQKVIYVNDGITTSIIQKKEDYNKMIFLIYSHDLIQKVAKEAKKIVFRKSVSRIFELKNTGNLPMVVSSISVENQGCYFNGFMITNCEGFMLEPGQSHRLEIMLTQTGNFETELKRDIYFLMGSRVMVFSFEVRSTDAFTPELASWVFVSSITHVFRLVAFIFVCILVLILFRHYHEMTSDLQFNLTDVQRSKYKLQLFADNITDLKTLEEKVKIQKVEQQKSRQIKNIGVKQMISTFKEASSREASFNAGVSDSEGHPLEPEKVPLTPKKKHSEEQAIVEDQLMVNIPSPGHKKKKHRKEKHHAGVPALNPEKSTKGKPADVPQEMENILEGIDKEIPEQRKVYRGQRPVEIPEPYKTRAAEEKGTRPTYTKPPTDLQKRSFREDSEESESVRKISEQSVSVRKDSSAQNHSRTSENTSTKRYNKEPSSRGRSREQPSTPNRYESGQASEKYSSENQSRQNIKSREEDERSYEQAPNYRDPKAERNYNRRGGSSSGQEFNDKDSSVSFEYVEKKQQPPSTQPTITQPDLGRQREKLFGRKDHPQGGVESYSRDQQNRSRYEKDTRRGKDKKREVVYYQRVDKPEEEFPSLSPYKNPDKIEYEIKTKPKEDMYTMKLQIKDDSQSFTPPLDYNDKEPVNNFREYRRKAELEARNHQGGSFSHEVNEDLREEHIAGHNVSGFDQNISMIHKVDDQDPDTSGLGIFRATAGFKEKQEVMPEQSISEGSSEESYEDVEKSHEKIRKLMEDTEEVKPDSLSPEGYHRRGEKVVGVIGEKAIKKPTLGEGSQRQYQGSSLLGFRQSANSYSTLRPQNQFSTRDSDSKPSLLNRPLGNYNPSVRTPYEPFGSSLNTSINKNRLLNKNYPEMNDNERVQQPPETQPKKPLEVPIIHYNQYGSFVPKSYLNQLPGMSRPVSEIPAYRAGRDLRRMDSQHQSDSQSQQGPEDQYSQDYDNYGYEAEEDEYYHDIYQQGHPNADRSFGNKPFKAAIQNNPFTLSRLGGSSNIDSGKKNLRIGPEYHQARPHEGERLDYYDSSAYSNSSYNKSKGGMRPPPGLTNDFGADVDPISENPKNRQPKLDKSGDSRGPYSSSNRSRGKQA